MLLISHTAMGIFIASHIQNPVLGSILAFSSHYLLDMIPHEPKSELFFVPPINKGWPKEIQENLNKRKRTSIFDFLGSLLLIISFLFFAKEKSLVEAVFVLIIIFFSLLPDILTIIYLKYPLGFLSEHYKFHYNIHKVFPLTMTYFTATSYQIILSLLLLWISIS